MKVQKLKKKKKKKKKKLKLNDSFMFLHKTETVGLWVHIRTALMNDESVLMSALLNLYLRAKMRKIGLPLYTPFLKS